MKKIILITILIMLNTVVHSQDIKNFDILNIELINSKLSESDAKNIYNYAVNYLYTQKKYVTAINVFERLIKYGDTSKIDEYLFWIGKTQFKNNNYSLCLETFNKIFYLYPNGKVIKEKKIEKSVYKILNILTRKNEVFWAAGFLHFSKKFAKKDFLKNKRLIDIYINRKIVVKSKIRKTNSYNGPIISDETKGLISKERDVLIVKEKINNEFDNYFKIRDESDIPKYITDNFHNIMKEIFSDFSSKINFVKFISIEDFKDYLVKNAMNFKFSIVNMKYYLTTDTKNRSWGGEGEFYIYHKFSLKELCEFKKIDFYNYIFSEFNDDI